MVNTGSAGQLISKCLDGGLQFPPKNEGKQVDLRFHSSKVEFVCSFFGGDVSLNIFLTL